MSARSTRSAAASIAIAVCLVALGACGEQETADLPAQVSLDTLPVGAPDASSPEGSMPLHSLNNLLVGALTDQHLEIAAAPFVEQCMAEAGFVVEFDPPQPGPSTYDEREQAANNGYIPSEPFFIEDALADRYVAIGDESEDEQARFAFAVSGSDAAGELADVEFSNGCAEEGRLAASSPLRLSEEQLDEHGEFIMSSIVSPSYVEAEVRFAGCTASEGVDIADSGDLPNLIEEALRSDDSNRAAELFALNDRCAHDTLDVAEIEATEIVANELLDRGAISAAVAREIIGG